MPQLIDPEVSLIISTRNRCQQLARCLDAIERIWSERDWELIIVDNGSVDDTAAVIEDFAHNSAVQVVHVLEPKIGKSNALNTALAKARGQIVAFTDDDCYPASDFLAQVWLAFVDPDIGYIAGRIMLHDPTDYPITINESTSPLTFPAGSYLTGGVMQGANMAFRRSALLEIGGFDPMFGPGTSYGVEDLDAAGRTSALGWNGRYCPEVVVRHHHGRKASDVPALMKFYNKGIGAYHMKCILQRDTRCCHLRFWFLSLPKRLIREVTYSDVGTAFIKFRVLSAIAAAKSTQHWLLGWGYDLAGERS